MTGLKDKKKNHIKTVKNPDLNSKKKSFLSCIAQTFILFNLEGIDRGIRCYTIIIWLIPIFDSEKDPIQTVPATCNTQSFIRSCKSFSLDSILLSSGYSGANMSESLITD